MRRADRLFQLIQILRGANGPLTGRQLAEELETSLRTVYRDVADLLAQRVPIRGEAGVGYVLEPGYDMPPLMLTPDEIEAAVLGAQWVEEHGDPTLVRAARDLIAKISDVVPDHLRPMLVDSIVTAPAARTPEPDALDMDRLRTYMRTKGKIKIRYRNGDGDESERVIWPVGLVYFETVRLIASWCELREDFRNFRTDRITAAEFLDETYPGRIEDLRAACMKHELEQQAKKAAADADPSP